MDRDKRFHLPSCAAMKDKELQDFTLKRQTDAQNGIVGLRNLGNTCFMNSSLQCLSNCYELTSFFLQEKYKPMTEATEKNFLGTEGRLVLAYAKLLNEMWNMNSKSCSPDLFKRILGQYAQQFEGYGQHDSHECINTILDLLGEDLYRHGKKPFVDMSEPEGSNLDDKANDTWNKHLHRNESVIHDLFHGQFKSTVCCSVCNQVSITFDPLASLLLPIPASKKKVKGFFVPYEMKSGYTNFTFEVQIPGSDSLRDMRK